MNWSVLKGLSVFVCGLALLGLAACGGGGGDPAPKKNEVQVTPAPTPKPDRYISYAVGRNYAWAIRTGDSRSSTRTAAVAACLGFGGTNCREVLWVRNACGALAMNADRNRAGVEWGPSKTDASTKAIAACRAAGGQTCQINIASNGSSSATCYTGGSSPAAGQASAIAPRSSSTPAPTPGGERRIQDISTTIPSSCPVEAEVCVRDHAAEDGDQVRVSINGNVAFSGEIFNRWQCRVVPVRSGQNQIGFLALNEGSSSPNTGSLRITGRGDDAGEVQEWRHDANTGSDARLLVTIGPAGGSCSVPGAGGTPSPAPAPAPSVQTWYAIALYLTSPSDGGWYTSGNVHGQSESSARAAVSAYCRSVGATACDISTASNSCYAIARGVLSRGGVGYRAVTGASTLTEAQNAAITECRRSATNCVIDIGRSGRRAAECIGIN